MAYQTIREIETKLLAFVPKVNSNVYTLDTVKRLAASLGNPEKSLRVVHIAGTSGKTTTSYYIAGLLARSGAHVGLTVSPHIASLTERAQLLGDPDSEAKFVAYFDQFFALVEKSGLQPSYFEFLMVFALWVFAREKVDYAVVETGLGGLLDASNICRRADKVAVVTDIGFDHMEILGSTLGEIAAQKAGIIAENNTCFMYRQGEDVMEAVERAAEKHQADLHVVADGERDLYLKRNFDLAAITVDYVLTRDGQQPLSANDREAVYREVHVPGRLEKLRVGKTVFVLDGAHNEPKMRALGRSLEVLYPDYRWPVILAMKSTKDYQAVVTVLKDFASRVIVSEFVATQDISIHAVPAVDLVSACRALAIPVDSADSLQAAASEYLESGAERVLVTGSFYALGQLRTWLIDHKQAKIEQ